MVLKKGVICESTLERERIVRWVEESASTGDIVIRFHVPTNRVFNPGRFGVSFVAGRQAGKC